MNQIDLFLHNCFSGDSAETCYVDQGSHLGLAFCRDTMGIGEICPRGLLNLRETLTAPGLRFLLEWDGLTKPVPVTGISLSTDAGGVTVSGVAAVGETVLRMRLQVTAASFNCYRMRLEMSSCGREHVAACRVSVRDAGQQHLRIAKLPGCRTGRWCLPYLRLTGKLNGCRESVKTGVLHGAGRDLLLCGCCPPLPVWIG